jgi:hypothetical protein
MIHPFEQILKKLSDFGLLKDDEERQKDEFLLFVEERMIPKTSYMLFLDEFNKLTGKSHKKPDVKSRKLFYEFEGTFSFEERIQAIKNILLDPWVKEQSSTYINPEMMCKAETLNKYISYTPPKTSSNGQIKPKVKDGDFTEVQNF